MAVIISKFDAAEHLRDQQDMAAYMASAVETGDPQYIAKAIGTVARAHGMAKISRESGLSRESLYRAFSDKGNPTLSTLLAVLKALNVKLTATVVEAETSNATSSTPGGFTPT